MCLADKYWSDKFNSNIGKIIQELTLIAYSEEKITPEELDYLTKICQIYQKPLLNIKDKSIKKTAEEILFEYFINPTSQERNQDYFERISKNYN